MTDIEQRALELVNAARYARQAPPVGLLGDATFYDLEPALIRALEAHESDKALHGAELREQAERFSEFAQLVAETYPNNGTLQTLAKPFILAPVDPLARVIMLCDEDCSETWAREMADRLRTHGVTIAIVKKEAVNG